MYRCEQSANLCGAMDDVMFGMGDNKFGQNHSSVMYIALTEIICVILTTEMQHWKMSLSLSGCLKIFSSWGHCFVLFFSIHPILLLYKIQILLSKSCPCGHWREAQGHRLITTRDRQLYNCGVVRCVSTSVIFICPCARIPSKADICVQSSMI